MNDEYTKKIALLEKSVTDLTQEWRRANNEKMSGYWDWNGDGLFSSEERRVLTNSPEYFIKAQAGRIFKEADEGDFDTKLRALELIYKVADLD